MTNDAWFPLGRPRAEARMSLFCFHHAGGGASAFANWRRQMPNDDIDLIPLQLPGREERIDEPAYRNMTELIAALIQVMSPWLDRPFAMFGHSFGAAVAFALASALPRTPSHLFLSSWSPALRPAVAAGTPALSDRDFIARMVRFGGIPAAVANAPDIMRVLLKPMRADIQILETYRPAMPMQLDCPATILGGVDDRTVRPEDLSRWASNGHPIVPVLFPGGHFYLRDALPAVLDLVISTLTPELCASPRK